MTPLALAALIATTAAADPAPYDLKWDPRIDGPVAGVLVGGWLVSEAALKKPLAPTTCHWCETNAFDTSIRRIFNPSLTPSAFGIAGPDMASNLVGFGALPIGLLLLDGLWSYRADARWDTTAVDVLLILEATFSAQLLNQVTKFLVARARPYTIGADPALLASAKDPLDHNLSFFSGHSTFAFALAAAAGTVASLRGYRFAWITWAVGMSLATTTAILRLAADKHWASDVIVGALVGSAVGVGVPLLFHGRQQAAAGSGASQGQALQLGISPMGFSVAGTF